MGLLSFFKRLSQRSAAPAAKPVADSADAVQQLRVRARRRLIGAAVLVGLGVIGFPLVFETQPRPIPIDLPIAIPNKEGSPALRAPVAGQLSFPAPTAVVNEPAPEPVVAEAPARTTSGPGTVAAAAAATTAVVAAQALTPKPSEKPVEKAAEKPADKPAAKSAEKAAEKTADKAAEKAAAAKAHAHAQEAARVQALLEGKAAAKTAEPAAGGRVILQVGAYADGKAAHEARLKVEKLGLKTYTQEVNTAGGPRIRVRVGPFASREEADKAAAKVRATGLSTAVLTL